jgi:hypothetical protein
MTKKIKFPRFNSYALEGDSITWESEGFTLTATLKYDGDTKPTDYECYSPIKIKQWKNDEWFYVGVIVSVSKNGIILDDHAASLWGVDCNYNKTSNKYLSTVAKDMEREAIECGKIELKRMIEKLQ